MVTPGERIHVIGIAGSGAAGVALLMHHAGLAVDGCDVDTPSPYTPPLEAAGIRVISGHDPAHLDGVERVAITPALRAVPDLPELVAARERGLPIVTWQHVLGELMSAEGHIGLAVTGTHGKSTTTALLGHLLIAAGMDPTVEVGAYLREWGATVRPGVGAPFVVEADEFGDNFLNYHPAGAIVTNVEMDHPDYFADRDAVLASMERFVRGMTADERLGGRLLLTTAADAGSRDLLARLDGWDGRVIRYGPGGEVAATDVELHGGGTRFRLFEHPFDSTLAGEHNVLNATAALTLARELGAPLEALAEGLRTFPGAGRRLELIADTAGVIVFDDYGHHPTEVRATIAAARQRVGERRLWAVFEPHMYSRTALLFDEFAGAFREADEVVIADIFASRDTDEALRATSAAALADAVERVSAVPSIAVGDVDATTTYVAEHLGPGDAVLVMGAGKSYRIAQGLKAALEAGVLNAPRSLPGADAAR
ncbi:MAG TPA: UDP-N-acetylmuramate--L-alanine ligase [Candidatus Limnocylindria bacterium]|jgi:UDP-N-acetylmuramate--alanine ligase|nr:UDP-N-acetylmuramate--L-alanine ligase [Candidatus Limnocylindria bacterium]